uniref:DUSP domain-containing protein n=1 Tax=Heterorhabditis bacteriophora TaxID=37862 RepID=A0A1I7WC26_HETBA
MGNTLGSSSTIPIISLDDARAHIFLIIFSSVMYFNFIEEYTEFSSWGLRPPLLTIPVNDSYISFYEVMSYVTHLSVDEVMELEKVFATISDRSVCKLSKSRWEAALSGCFPDKFVGHNIAYLVLAKLWDEDCDNMLSDLELQKMYDDLNVLLKDRTVVKSSGEKAAPVDFATWANANEYVKEYYAMAVEIGHICLGLRPEAYKVEFALVSSFERRSRDLPLPEWNIVSSSWHKEWAEMAAEGKMPPPVNNSGIRGIKADDGWSGKVACISAESANLRLNVSRKEFIAVPPTLWRAWLRWHGSALSVDGQFTRKRLSGEFFDNGQDALELYPLDILLLGHDKKK